MQQINNEKKDQIYGTHKIHGTHNKSNWLLYCWSQGSKQAACSQSWSKQASFNRSCPQASLSLTWLKVSSSPIQLP